MRPVILTSAYLAPVQYFTKLYAAPLVIEERAEHYVKQTYRNRCIIAGPDGPLTLTIPVEHDRTQRPLTRDIRLSDHGNWRHLHRTALTSAYDRSPYFAYYADDLLPLYDRPFRYLVDLNEAFRHTLCDLLDLHPDIRVSEQYTEANAETDDLREVIRPKRAAADDTQFRPEPYYQVFADRTGFLPNLSMADLLFNMGPESRIILRKCITSGKETQPAR